MMNNGWIAFVDAALTDLSAAKKDELQPMAHVQDAIDNLNKAIDAYDEMLAGGE